MHFMSRNTLRPVLQVQALGVCVCVYRKESDQKSPHICSLTSASGQMGLNSCYVFFFLYFIVLGSKLLCLLARN